MRFSQQFKALAALLAAVVLSACQIPPPDAEPYSEGHINSRPPAAVVSGIPDPVRQTPFVPLPRPEAPVETYTVVVSEVPVKELLFALARDASVNIDVHPDVAGNVTLNAIDQTLSQILDRIARQVPVRYEERNDTLAVVPDSAYLKNYRVDYVNIARDSNGSIASSTLVGAALAQEGTAGNRSDSVIRSTSNNRFWETLAAALTEIARPAGVASGAEGGQVVVNAEAGIIMVRATDAQHRMVQAYIDEVMTSATRQVLIEATIVEIELNDRYQAGIDWQVFTRGGGLLGAGISLGTDLVDAFDSTQTSGNISGFVLNASDAPNGSSKRDVQASLQALSEFGDTQVLSSPKVMTLNNQPAVLKVVDNEVYFSLDIETSQNQNTTIITTQSEVETVAVGLVMSVTPQVSSSGEVMLNVRPSVTRVREFVEDPAVPIALAQAQNLNINISNRIPVVQTRETEAVMRVGSGQLAVLGGLMQDRTGRDDEAVPGASEVPGLGELFKFRDRARGKTELVVFLRPTVIRSPDVNADLADFRRFLPDNLGASIRQQSPLDKPAVGSVAP